MWCTGREADRHHDGVEVALRLWTRNNDGAQWAVQLAVFVPWCNVAQRLVAIPRGDTGRCLFCKPLTLYTGMQATSYGTLYAPANATSPLQQLLCSRHILFIKTADSKRYQETQAKHNEWNINEDMTEWCKLM
jgi:hypothetical protein